MFENINFSILFKQLFCDHDWELKYTVVENNIEYFYYICLNCGKEKVIKHELR